MDFVIMQTPQDCKLFSRAVDYHGQDLYMGHSVGQVPFILTIAISVAVCCCRWQSWVKPCERPNQGRGLFTP